MAQNVIISLIFGQFVSNLDTKRIFERSSHWKHEIIPPPEQTWLTTPQVFETFVRYNFTVKWISGKNLHTQRCKLSYCLGARPIYTRNKVFLNVFIFLLCRLLNSICDILYVCCGDLGYIPNNTFQLVYLTCGLLIFCYHFRKIRLLFHECVLDMSWL